MKNYYHILGVKPTASNDVIQKVYRSISKTFHPDKYPGDKDFAAEKFKEINEAYSILSDTNKRMAFDKSYSSFLNKQNNKNIYKKDKPGNAKSWSTNEKLSFINKTKIGKNKKYFTKYIKMCLKHSDEIFDVNLSSSNDHDYIKISAFDFFLDEIENPTTYSWYVSLQKYKNIDLVQPKIFDELVNCMISSMEEVESMDSKYDYDNSNIRSNLRLSENDTSNNIFKIIFTAFFQFIFVFIGLFLIYHLFLKNLYS
jgi:curved DNA-binding protein CbpA